MVSRPNAPPEARRHEAPAPAPDDSPQQASKDQTNGTGRVGWVISKPSQVFAAIGAVLLIILMAGTVIDVLRRTITDESLHGMIEVSPLLLLSAVMLGLGYAELAGTHVRTSLVTSRLPPRARFVFRLIGGVVGAALMLWISWLSVGPAFDAFEQTEVTPGFVAIPTWPARALIPLGFLFFSLQLTLKVIEDWKALRSHSTQGFRESEAELIERTTEGDQ